MGALPFPLPNSIAMSLFLAFASSSILSAGIRRSSSAVGLTSSPLAATAAFDAK